MENQTTNENVVDPVYPIDNQQRKDEEEFIDEDNDAAPITTTTAAESEERSSITTNQSNHHRNDNTKPPLLPQEENELTESEIDNNIRDYPNLCTKHEYNRLIKLSKEEKIKIPAFHVKLIQNYADPNTRTTKEIEVDRFLSYPPFKRCTQEIINAYLNKTKINIDNCFSDYMIPANNNERNTDTDKNTLPTKNPNVTMKKDYGLGEIKDSGCGDKMVRDSFSDPKKMKKMKKMKKIESRKFQSLHSVFYSVSKLFELKYPENKSSICSVAGKLTKEQFIISGMPELTLSDLLKSSFEQPDYDNETIKKRANNRRKRKRNSNYVDDDEEDEEDDDVNEEEYHSDNELTNGKIPIKPKKRKHRYSYSIQYKDDSNPRGPFVRSLLFSDPSQKYHRDDTKHKNNNAVNCDIDEGGNLI